MTGERQDQLLTLVGPLVCELKEVEIRYQKNGRPTGQHGVDSACMGHVTSYLKRVRDRGALAGFMAALPQLDPLTAQNPDNPQAKHAALSRVLTPWLAAHSDLEVDELLYVLSWAHRLLPRKPGSG